MCECCGGDCRLNDSIKPPTQLNDASALMVKHLISIGRAQRLLEEMLDNDFLFKLSKHNTYWHSVNPDDAEKLDDLRSRFACLYDNLLDLNRILRIEE